MQSPRDPAIPLLECAPKRPENWCQNKYLCTSVQHYSQQTKVEATQMSHQQMSGLSRTMEYDSAIERKQVLITCYSMDEPWNHDAKRKTPIITGHILYEYIYTKYAEQVNPQTGSRLEGGRVGRKRRVSAWGVQSLLAGWWKRFRTRHRWWLHNMEGVLNAIELYILKGQCYMNFTSVKEKRMNEWIEAVREPREQGWEMTEEKTGTRGGPETESTQLAVWVHSTQPSLCPSHRQGTWLWA